MSEIIGSDREKALSIIASDGAVFNRRRFLTGAALVIASPVIVRASSLMDIRGVPLRTALEYVPCDGRALSVLEKSIYDHVGQSYSPVNIDRLAPPPDRFFMPDFTQGFDFGVGAGKVQYEMDRGGDLFMSLSERNDAARRAISNGAFSLLQIESLMNGGKVKL